ncbi:MAG: type III pantothenate kinase [Clostridia bacterium]|nr:type III pantothenate kinase [Clostridia bacterium]
MLLAVNIGNSHISAGIFNDSGALSVNFKISTDVNKTSDEYSTLIHSIISERNFDITQVDAVIISSVVPQLTSTMLNTLMRITGITPLIVGPGVKTGFSIKIDNPSELGADMVANTAAVIENQKRSGGQISPSVIVDMNTVTTVSAVNKSGEYAGCAIFPGVQMSFDSMHGNTALLPNVMLSSPQKAIGKNSQDSVRSGVILGNAIMLDGFVYRFSREMKCKIEELNLTITGEYAKSVINVCNSKFGYDEHLTLKGLYCIYRSNIK